MDPQKIDFLQCLEADMALCILSFLDEPADLIRASAVSRFWRQFVIGNGVAKHLCLKKYPKLSEIVGIVDTTEGEIDTADIVSNTPNEWEILKRDQKVYAALLEAITKSTVSIKDCIANAISASSTDNYPDESVVNTLNPKDRFIRRASYWSSTGQEDPDVPETLIYKLRDGIWVISEIDIQPYEAIFQDGNPIYSAKSVRFRIGHPKCRDEFKSYPEPLPLQKCAGDKFVWTYTSPEFPMEQENRLQSFKLPEPVLCIGGYIQIELLGRVQRQDFDGLFYICVCYVRARGRSVFPAFDIETIEPQGNVLLKYHPENLSAVLKSPSSDEVPRLRDLEDEIMSERIELLEDLLRGIQQGPNNRFVWGGGDDGLVL